MAYSAMDERPPAVKRRLPGRARRRTDVLREYEKLNAEQRSHVPSVLWPFLAPDADRHYRWRVELSCGCITELLTYGDRTPPHERRWGTGWNGQPLPPGQLYCKHDESDPVPYREITEWKDRREVAFPPDPTEPPEWITTEVWAVLRHDKPRTEAFWTVQLECGHSTEVVAPSIGWKPEHGPCVADPVRVREMADEFDQASAADLAYLATLDGQHMRRMIAAGWPSPRPEQRCSVCVHARTIIAYQAVGWLVPRGTVPEQPTAPPARDALERRLRRAEADAERLRAQLARIDD
ncbi:hypothetical protein [Kitasatospora sp. MBT63]|uniref:hypothetical protein n=1 Tax=Kitasatospora sp. MBT63 TaxID=1444768 RepID=UPI00053B01E7|nr:hypothetical protein [Kitasatospora sp. MBT63]